MKYQTACLMKSKAFTISKIRACYSFVNTRLQIILKARTIVLMTPQAKGGNARAAKLNPKRIKAIARMGAKAKNEAMTPEERSEAARKAVQARWRKQAKKKAPK